MKYDLISVELAEAMTLDQFAALPLETIECIVRSYAGAAVRISDRPHEQSKQPTCPRGHLRSAHGLFRPNGTLAYCKACRREQVAAIRSGKVSKQ